MTIYKKGWFDELKPSLESIGDSVVRIMNPNYDTQQALKKLIATNPDIAQKIANMGPDAVEKLYGKEMRKYAEAMPKDIQTQITDTIRPQLPALLADPNTQRLLREKELGIDPTGQVIKENQAKISTETARSAPAVADANIAQSTQQIEDIHRAAAAKAVVESTRKRLGKVSLAEAFKKGLLTPSEKGAIFQDEAATKEVKTEIDTEFEKQRLGLAGFEAETGRMNAITARQNANRERLSGTPQGMMMQAQMEIAKHVAERSGNATLFAPLMELQKNPELQNQLEGLPKPPPGQEALWQAAQANKDYKSAITTKMKQDRVSNWTVKTGRWFTIANDPKKSKEERQNAVNNINAIGTELFGEFGADRPIVEFDKGAGFTDWLKDSRTDVRRPSVVIHGGSELTGMIKQENPDVQIGTTTEERKQVNQGLQMWSSASLEDRRASLAKMPKDKQDKMKKILTDAGIQF